ncbi:MAG: HAD family hydrolase [Ruminococcus sp.]|nr:haloacid dehalogenase-like hydrolase [Ruminococcus sp.]MDO4419038.1 HAD family hydrolase [Ruminococcus sp.]
MQAEPIIAIMYDFDKTLCTRDMQEYDLIPKLNMSSEDFWAEANGFGRAQKMDGILAYMYTCVKRCREKGVSLKRESFVESGRNVELYNGVDTWFDRINAFGKEQGARIEHYVISSGMKEIIEGTSIADKFTEIFACEFYYDEQGNAAWPKTAVNYTNKTQFVYRINKGVLDVSNDVDLNRSMPDDSKRVPFTNMIYIGDGLSDVPCMKMMKAYGGQAIAVYQDDSKKKVEELLIKDRVDFIFPADYSVDGELDRTVKNIIKKVVISDALTEINQMQLKGIGD